MQEYGVQAYLRLVRAIRRSGLAQIPASEVFQKYPAPSGSNTQLEKTFNLATGTEVAPLLERRNPSPPALGGCVIVGSTREGDSEGEKDRGLAAQRPFFI